MLPLGFQNGFSLLVFYASVLQQSAQLEVRDPLDTQFAQVPGCT